MSKPTTGKVILAGAGPGDPELITLKLQRALGEADVVLVDRLVNPQITDNFAAPHALVLMTGKQGFHDGSVAQEDINKLMIGHARNGKTVLRLKGGDVAIFSNILDELQSLHNEQIPFEIIPGITAASGASAYAGIPLTARGIARNVQFITFNPCGQYDALKWKSFIAADETLVFYMAGKSLPVLVEQLLMHGASLATPIAVIEQATTQNQRVHLSTLEASANDFAEKQFSSPSLVITGDVVNLHRQFDWYRAGLPGSVFADLIIDK